MPFVGMVASSLSASLLATAIMPCASVCIVSPGDVTDGVVIAPTRKPLGWLGGTLGPLGVSRSFAVVSAGDSPPIGDPNGIGGGGMPPGLPLGFVQRLGTADNFATGLAVADITKLPVMGEADG